MKARIIRHLARVFVVLTSVAMGSALVKADAITNITGFSGVSVYGLDNAGQVLVSDGSGGLAFYQNGQLTSIPIPQAPGVGGISNAVVSQNGTIAFSYLQTSTNDAQVYRNGQVCDAGAPVYGGTLGGGPYSAPFAVNDSGVVVGYSHAQNRWNQAFVSSPGVNASYQATALGAGSGTISNATAINNQGVVVGWTDVAGHWRDQAFVGTPANGIGTLGGLNSGATAINNAGVVVGWSTIGNGLAMSPNNQSYNDTAPIHAFVFDQSGKMHDLGALVGYQNSIATAINSMGQIVGYATNSASPYFSGANYGFNSTPERALLFENGNVIDLNSLLTANSGWILQDALAINDSGQIAGYGTYNGIPEGFLLTLATDSIAPVPEPSTMLLFGVTATGGIVGTLRRRRS